MANDIKSMTEMKDLLRIENGEKVKHTFSDQEYINRQSKLRAYMAAERSVWPALIRDRGITVTQ